MHIFNIPCQRDRSRSEKSCYRNSVSRHTFRARSRSGGKLSVLVGPQAKVSWPWSQRCVKRPKIIINFNKRVYYEKKLQTLANVDNERWHFFKRFVNFVLNIFCSFLCDLYFKKINHRLSNICYMACFADRNVSQGSVATTNSSRNFPVNFYWIGSDATE